MKSIRYTLLTDGSSDKALLPILNWVLKAAGVTIPIQSEWADLTRLRPFKRLSEKLKWTIELYPCELLFVHRDAEREPLSSRVAEIRAAVQECAAEIKSIPPYVCVVPVRMQEAWLLFDEAAIRKAAGNPNGRILLSLPSLSDVEELPNPKHDLEEILRVASELSRRRRLKLNTRFLRSRVVENIDNFEPLRRLTAFQALEAEVQTVLSSPAWNVATSPF